MPWACLAGLLCLEAEINMVTQSTELRRLGITGDHRLTTHVHICIFISWFQPPKGPKNTLTEMNLGLAGHQCGALLGTGVILVKHLTSDLSLEWALLSLGPL